MFSRSIYLVALSFFLFTGCSVIPYNSLTMPKDFKSFDQEDEYILHAIEYSMQNKHENSRKLYITLFEKTKKHEYLVHALNISLQIRDYESAKQLSFENLNKSVSQYQEIYKIYIISLVNLKEYDEAKKQAELFINEFNTVENNDFVANIYYINKDFINAAKYFKIVYNQNLNPQTLINLIDIYYSFIDEKQKAISHLETHIRLKGCEKIVCTKLLSIYEEEKNIDGIISVLKRMYTNFKQEEDFESMIKTYNILINYLEQKDVNEAIKFLEDNSIDDKKLVSLYKQANQTKKALDITKKLYELNKNIDLLAQIAILEFEDAKNKKTVLKSVIKKFEDVLAVLDNHIYQNYLGYILIDYNVDVKKGLKLVKKALEKAPNNLAYIDSLAWGLYKQKNCQDAYTHMKKVVDAIGLNEEEIKLHWDKIKECSKK